jgi:hypothetical protein
LSQLTSIRAGGVGVNLQAADTVILFDTDWNPQAMKFLYMIFYMLAFIAYYSIIIMLLLVFFSG